MPTSRRLGTEAPRLAEELLAAGPSRQRHAALVAAELALRENGVREPWLAPLIAAVRSGHGASVASAIARRVEEADVIAFDVADATDEGRATAAEYERAFCRARALNALQWAADPDPAAAALEAAYEAAAAVEGMSLVEAALRPALDGGACPPPRGSE